jgi:hypothetical protein
MHLRCSESLCRRTRDGFLSCPRRPNLIALQISNTYGLGSWKPTALRSVRPPSQHNLRTRPMRDDTNTAASINLGTPSRMKQPFHVDTAERRCGLTSLWICLAVTWEDLSNSNNSWRFNQNRGVVPKYRASLSAVSVVIPRFLLTSSLMRFAGTWRSRDSLLIDKPSGSMYSSRKISPGCTAGKIVAISYFLSPAGQ